MKDKDTLLLEDAYENSDWKWLEQVARKAHNAMFSKNEEGNIRRRPEFGEVQITKISHPYISLGMSLSQSDFDKIDLSEYIENKDEESAIKEIHNRIIKLASDPEFQKRQKEHDDSLRNMKINWD